MCQNEREIMAVKINVDNSKRFPQKKHSVKFSLKYADCRAISKYHSVQ